MDKLSKVQQRAGTNAEGDETPDGEFYARDQKRLPATVEETEEIEEIENSPMAFEGCRCIGARSAPQGHCDGHATRNFGENINRYVHYASMRDAFTDDEDTLAKLKNGA